MRTFLPARASYQYVRIFGAIAAAGWVSTAQPILLEFATFTVVAVIVSTGALIWAQKRAGRTFELDEIPTWLVAADIFAVSAWMIGSAVHKENAAFALFGIVAGEATFRHGWRGALTAFGCFSIVRIVHEIVRLSIWGDFTPAARFGAEILITAILVLFLAAVVVRYREARRRAKALADVAASFGTAPALDTIAVGVVEGALLVLDADYAVLTQRGPRGFHRLAGAGRRVPQLPGDERVGVVNEVLRTGVTTQIDDYQRYPQAVPSIRASGVRTVLATPVRVDGRVLACLVVGRHRPIPFDSSDREALEALAGHAAIAIANARLIAQARHLEALTRELALERDDDRLLQRVSDAAAELLHAEFALVAWLEPGKEGKRAASGLAIGYDLPTRRPSHGVLGRLLAERRRVIVEDHSAWPEAMPDATALGLHSIVADPIFIDRVPVAAVVIATTDDGRRFTEDELAVLSALVDQASVAVRGAGRRRDRERRLGRLARLNEVAHELSRVHEPRQLYRLVYEAARDLVPTDSFYLSLYEQSRRSHAFVLIVDEGNEYNETAHPLRDGPTSRVVLTGRPLLTLQAQNNDVRFGDEARPSQSAIHVPMRLADRIVGVLSTQRYVERGYDDEDVAMLETLASHAAAAIENAQLLGRTHELYLASVRALAAAVDARDPYTRSHSTRTSVLARAIAEEMALPAAEVRRVQLGALLHDIGKIGIPDAVLNKPGVFTQEERLVMMTHPALGGAILQAVEPLRELVPVVRYHHERYDGGGYPEGLAGDEVPLAAYIVAAADAFEVIVSKRAYKEAKSLDFAIEELRANAGAQFHPDVIAAFLRVLERDRGRGSAYVQRLTQQDHEDLEAVAGPAVLVEQLAASSQAHARQLAILHRLASEITAVLDIEALTERLLRIVCDAMGYESGFLATLDPDGDLVVQAAVGPSSSYVGFHIQEAGVSWLVMKSGEARNIRDVSEFAHYGPPEIRSSLIVPLALGDERIGVIGVESTRIGAFETEDELLLSTVSHQLAAAIRVARLHQDVKTAAATDPLTGLANRRTFFQRLEAEVARARAESAPLTVAIVDVNGLKTVNDTHGHGAGDAALGQIGRILAAGVRDGDLVARYGGDEFALVFPGATVLVAERIMRRLADEIVADRSLAVGLPAASWGIATLHSDVVSADALIEAADQEMYRQKLATQGRAKPA